jgi:hypothetical protein
MYRTSYPYNSLSETARKNAANLYPNELLTQWLYNIDGTKFESSTTIQL